MPAEERRNPPIMVRVLGSRVLVPRVVTVLREVLDVTYTTPTYKADLPYEVHRFVGAEDLCTSSMPAVMADIAAAVKSWSRGNLEAQAAMERIQQRLDR